jgi:hypothetical protein
MITSAEIKIILICKVFPHRALRKHFYPPTFLHLRYQNCLYLVEAGLLVLEYRCELPETENIKLKPRPMLSDVQCTWIRSCIAYFCAI